MIGYASVIAPRVRIAAPAPKPLPRVQAMRDLIAKGKSPAEAMAILERKDNHRPKTPEAKPDGQPIGVTEDARARVLDAIYAGHRYGREISDRIGMGRKRVSATLADLVAAGTLTATRVRATDAARSTRMAYEVAA